jgi:hypothetical protein
LREIRGIPLPYSKGSRARGFATRPFRDWVCDRLTLAGFRLTPINLRTSWDEILDRGVDWSSIPRVSGRPGANLAAISSAITHEIGFSEPNSAQNVYAE